MSASAEPRANVLLFGGGAVGAIAALNIETGGLGAVTAVLRSNFQVVRDTGYTIESVDHGSLKGWRPTKGEQLSLSLLVNTVPDVSKENLPPFDYIVTTTKNCPDIPPTLPELIRPAVTPGHTTIVMIQNGLNIERAMFEAFPTNVVLSGVSMIDSHEGQLGEILHEEKDVLHLGAFQNPTLDDHEREIALAHNFIQIYGAGGKTDVRFSEDVPWARWRKLVFNAVLNPLCAITGLDDARIRLTDSLVEGLVRPAMKEIIDTAAKLGHILPADISDTMIHLDPMDLYLKPSMQCDIEKASEAPCGNFMEFEYLLGEPLREARKVGVATPNLNVLYEICKALQWKIKEQKGLVKVPPKRIL
ncbi:hypothetical protein A1O3_04676 [Capronia epimyces CBS 606.96]|uniref:2-dehydropantoate 2-reductase n=1 Tax=Capronia epimyces CBS 606.96 TaxID=1182542 RepID=W9YP19_9EURO|nr:uncharacterized protein A1O3_04676 [Capronia epimyces CBS 606.96]EXJ84009.1 hypothetical protein A1O3_04676 [Capronia epimyces CBS 606.96]